jgi:hypothetical protein
MALKNGGSMANCIDLMALLLSVQQALKNGGSTDNGIDLTALLISMQLAFKNGGSTTNPSLTKLKPGCKHRQLPGLGMIKHRCSLS